MAGEGPETGSCTCKQFRLAAGCLTVVVGSFLPAAALRVKVWIVLMLYLAAWL